jgi:hypothetical protein
MSTHPRQLGGCHGDAAAHARVNIGEGQLPGKQLTRQWNDP